MTWVLSLALKALPGPAVLWRWGAIAALVVTALGSAYWRGVSHESDIFEAYKGKVKDAGDRQNALAREQERTWKQLVEATERESKLRTDRLAADLDAARLRNSAVARGRIVPQAPAAAGVGDRVCYSGEQLDRGLREALGGLYRDVTRLAEEGQLARDLAADCVGYVKALGK